MCGPTCIFWANLTPFSLEGWNRPRAGTCAFNMSAPGCHENNPGGAGCPWIPCDCPDGGVARGEVWSEKNTLLYSLSCNPPYNPPHNKRR
jgi:hypothetical protein